ncbi:phosphotransferase system IIB component [Mycoplasma testudineum]|uniref:Phosphotransferase system IIB component n=1 Tax=Mycoplasma testudineum TaxID=244584 RepID=A0A4R6IG50_9MOLU|nr:PTS transporter subunit EIIB [Mycoplasma testudineum]OYD26779.1 hypothetical protein CG473_02385 [Mycoplasma testudineum]TDO19915.1 phosphotransferase system IIB component [Mycoplasma testudineum]
MSKIRKVFAKIANIITFGALRRRAIKNNNYLDKENVKTSFNENELWELLGGINNINSVSATLSKLRINFENNKLVNVEKIKKYPEVTGVLLSTKSINIIMGAAAKELEQKINQLLKDKNV